MKKAVFLISFFAALVTAFMLISCRPHEAPTEPNLCAPVTCTPTVVPAANVTLSFTIYNDAIFLTPVPNLTVTVYRVDGTASRTGGVVTTASSNASGAFSITVPSGNYYELETTGNGSTTHTYLPQATASKSGIKLLHADASAMSSIVTGGIVVLINTSGLITSSDTVVVDGGANINNSTSSPGLYSVVEILYSLFGNYPGIINFQITQSTSPGTAHALTLDGITRNVRVQMLSSNHISIAVYY